MDVEIPRSLVDHPRPDTGTPVELLPISEEVLIWVAEQRRLGPHHRPLPNPQATDDDLRRIELMALAVRETAFRHSLYPEVPDAPSSDPQGQRSEAEGLPRAQARRGCPAE